MRGWAANASRQSSAWSAPQTASAVAVTAPKSPNGRARAIRSVQRADPQQRLNSAAACSGGSALSSAKVILWWNGLSVVTCHQRARSTRAAVQTQAGDAAVRKDVQAHMGHIADRRNFPLERVERIGLQRDARHQLTPCHGVRLKSAPLRPPDALASVSEAGVETARAGGVALEVLRVDVHAPD